MNEQEFLRHHGLSRNPFADEDAQTDVVFKDFCISSSFHPSWSKVQGDPREPSTAIVLGPKGSGKTAMRLQLDGEYRKFNLANPDHRVFIVHYDDFNAYMGPFEQKLSARHRGNPDRVLKSLRLWDHMDAILCEGVTDLVDSILSPGAQEQGKSIRKEQLASLDRGQKRDLLLLAACYDQSKVGTFQDRWGRLRKEVGFGNIATWYDFLGGALGSFLVVLVLTLLFRGDSISLSTFVWSSLILLIAVWSPYLWRFARCWLRAFQTVSKMRVGRRDLLAMTRTLMAIPMKELAGQALPSSFRTDDRYALLEKFQLLLRSLGFDGMVVLVDRVDEPDLVNGLPERMKQLVWPMLDNKLLKHPGLGFKLLLPNELQSFMDREDREFHERARLDKQNVIRSFDWTGEALYDLVESRMKACAVEGKKPNPMELFDSGVSEQRLLAAMQSLRTPRSLFRCFYRMLAEHCKSHRSSNPEFKISATTFESTLAVFQQEVRNS